MAKRINTHTHTSSVCLYRKINVCLHTVKREINHHCDVLNQQVDHLSPHRNDTKHIYLSLYPDKSISNIAANQIAHKCRPKKIAGIYFEISFVLPILCHHKITVHKLQSNINADLLLMSH